MPCRLHVMPCLLHVEVVSVVRQPQLVAGCCPTQGIIGAAVPWNPVYTVRLGAGLGRMVVTL